MSETELAIFDCDGVLVDSETISNAVLAQALTTGGLPTTLAEARRDYQGMLLSEVVAEAQRRLGRLLPGDWLTRYERERAEAFHRELKPVPDAAEAVKRVSAAGIAVCVASQGKLSLWRYRHKASYVAGRVMSRGVLRIVASARLGAASGRFTEMPFRVYAAAAVAV